MPNNAHTTFVKTPYPQPQVAHERASYVDAPKVAYTADYFNADDDSSRVSTRPSYVTSSYGSGSTPGEIPMQQMQPVRTSVPVQMVPPGQQQQHVPPQPQQYVPPQPQQHVPPQPQQQQQPPNM
ncbi:hypothetical protein GGF43_006631 [Coemansia sp. RSA 2618]|nr:hypothetical protein GGF43_006631 [Coemansia sp. RSA 2618]